MAKKSSEIASSRRLAETEDVGATQAVLEKAALVEFGQAERDLATYLGVNISTSANVRTEQAVFSYNVATRHLVEAGLLLASVKAEIDHAAFMDLLEERGMAKERAYELIRGACFAARLPDGQRELIMALPKTKVLALASADPQVVRVMLEDGDIDVSQLSVRDMRMRIRELEAANTDLVVQRDTADAELATARKKLNAPEDRQDSVPVVIADLRSEVVALGKKASLAVDGFNPLGRDIVNLLGSDAAYMWADATLRLALAQLAAIGLQVEGLLKSFKDALGDDGAGAVEMSYLSGQEIVEAAQKFKELIAEHEHEAALRAWEREQERPRDKGRPRSKPEAPAKSRKG